MSKATNYLEDKVLDHVFGKGVRNLTSPANLYLALHSADPTETGAVAELSGNGYARQSMTFGASSGGTTSSSDSQTFTASGGGWSAATHMSIWDAVTAGNCLVYGPLTTSKTLADGDSLVFAIGAVDVSLD
jgi:hypothetical protein